MQKVLLSCYCTTCHQPYLKPHPSIALVKRTFPKSGEKYKDESSVSSRPELQSSMDTAASSVNFFSFWVFPCACLAELFSKTSVVKRAAVMALTCAQDDKFERG